MPASLTPADVAALVSLDDAQVSGLGDMSADEFRRHGHAVIERIATYLDEIASLDVLPTTRPGEVAAQLPAHAPASAEPFEEILADIDRVIVPGLTHWNHPAFHAYFSISASGAGILGEALTAGFNVNAMMWKTSPAATELEEVVTDWLRQLLGLPDGLRGVLMDGASAASLVALAAARERAGLDVRQRGFAGRPDIPPLRVYVTSQTHSSVEKAAITLGLGRDGVLQVATDEQWRMDPEALAAAIRDDQRMGIRPLAVVATVGTTTTTAVDPVAAIADVCERHGEAVPGGLWLHVDGAYGGMAGVTPAGRWVLDGVERADSFLTNPHKWLFTPIDCTALYVRDPEPLTRAFSLVPDYLLTAERAEVTDYMDWGVQLGRRFRALKLWMVLRYFGADGIRTRIESVMGMARHSADRIDASPLLERMAEVPLSTVCFRVHPGGIDDGATLDALTTALVERVNASGAAFVMPATIGGATAIRFAIGNLRTTAQRLDETLTLITDAAAEVVAERQP